MNDGQKLLAEYVRTHSDDVFRKLVNGYIDLVYSTALRLVEGDAHRAEDVAQTVFVDLARTGSNLSSEVMLGGWLHRHTCFVAAKTMRGERRRQSREREAVEMNALQEHSNTTFSTIAPELDEAINELDEADRKAILLRFFEQYDFRSVGQALGSTEDAARMRVNRALEKLEVLLKRRGVTTTAAALSTALLANAVQAAPVGLAVTISTAAATLTATTLVTTTAATATKAIAMTTLQKAIIGATLATVAGVGVYQAHQSSQLRNQVQTLRQQQAPMAEQIRQLQHERDEATNRLASLRDENERLNGNTVELLKLRSEVARLRDSTKANTPGLASDDSEEAVKSWLARVRSLKQRLESKPELKIPELRFITEDDWLNATRMPLLTDEDYRRALSRLRNAGKTAFASVVSAALRRYADANDGNFPPDISQLQPYFKSKEDFTILGRYQIAPSPVSVGTLGSKRQLAIVEKSPVDEEFDARFYISLSGIGSVDFKGEATENALRYVLTPVLKAYLAANNGQQPTTPSQLLPFATTSDQRAMLEELILKNEAK